MRAVTSAVTNECCYDVPDLKIILYIPAGVKVPARVGPSRGKGRLARRPFIQHGGAVGVRVAAELGSFGSLVQHRQGQDEKSGTTSCHIEWRGPFVQSTGSRLMAGHVDRPPCPFDRVKPLTPTPTPSRDGWWVWFA